jgi:hypothetical protein
MYQSQQEIQKKEKQYKVYVILFILFTLINVILYIVEGSIIRGIVTLLVFAIVVYFGLQKKFWAEVLIKFMVWIYVIIIIIILLIVIF